MSKQKIKFCRSSDSTRIAYATVGSGSPLVKAANYITHLEHDWQSPVWNHWLTELSRHHTLIRYDERGCGLSDRDISQFSVDAWVSDLEAVVEAMGLERFPLLGISQGASISVAYAIKHPDKVTQLILYGGYARGRFKRGLNAKQHQEAETMIDVIRLGWGQENPAFRQLFTTQLMPDGSQEQMQWLNQLARISATPETAATMERAFYHIDVTHLAKGLSVPTLVLHARDDACIPFEEGVHLATLIPDAHFVPLDSRNHILLQDEPAWKQFLDEVHAFLVTPTSTEDSAIFGELTPREREVLERIAQGLSNEEIAEQLHITTKTVRNYSTRIYRKLSVERRAEAIVLARESGYGHRSRSN